MDGPQEREKEDCWKAYSLVTDMYTPSPERLRDWLSNPKSNGYEALHTTVMGPQGRWVEVQIRSRRMDEIAEKVWQPTGNTKKVLAKTEIASTIGSGRSERRLAIRS